MMRLHDIDFSSEEKRVRLYVLEKQASVEFSFKKPQLCCSETIRLCDAGEKCGAPCTRGQFTCDNGCCLDPGLECDTIPQCGDGSDEKKCEDCK